MKDNLIRNKIDSQKGGNERSSVVGIGFCGTGAGSNAAVVDVKNGKIARIKPLHFDWKYDKKQFNPWKMEARGKTFEPTMKSLMPPYSLAYKKRVYSPNRILYPLKRVDWDPNGERNPQNRGISKYERISWDEATEIITSELKRIKSKYGPNAVLAQTDGHGESKTVHVGHGSPNRLLDLLGGYTLQGRNNDSWEGWVWGAKHVWGMEPVGQMDPAINVMLDVAENTDTLLFWGCDPETTPWAFDGQMASRLCYFWSELGIKQIYVCPDLNYGAAVHADKWIPILPGTDAALHLAVAYTWLNEGTFDKEYVATHTVGLEKFKDYVLGKEDAVPKTPDWASPKCGIPAWTIKALAREWASRRTSIAHGNGGPGIRSPYSTENGRLEILLLAMQGLGKPGAQQVKMIEWGMWGHVSPKMNRSNPMPPGVVQPTVTEAQPIRNMRVAAQKLRTQPDQFIPKQLIHDALLNPPISWYGTSIAMPVEEQFKKYTYPSKDQPEVHMIWTDSPCWITCWNDSNRFISAVKSPKIEFILAQHPWLENDCLFADIILPVCTKFELADIEPDNMGGQFSLLLYEKKCIEPLGESKSDYEIVCMIAEKMGLLDEYKAGMDLDVLIKTGFNHSGVQDMTTFEEFKDKGYFVVPTNPEWKKLPMGLRLFYEDPEHHPLSTPSGKIEFYSERLDKNFPDDKERPPVPHWIESGETHDERRSGKRAKEYPLLLVSNHGRWRVHAQHDDISWTREAPTCKVKGPDGYMYEPLWINQADAATRGIKNGDVVKVYNERGTVLGGAYVTERIMPGTVYMDHGARYDPIVPGEIDRGGAINTITPHKTTSKNVNGMVASSFLVEVQLADLGELNRKHPEAFRRPYQAAAGLRFERVLAKPAAPAYLETD